MESSFTSAKLALKLLNQLREGGGNTFFNEVLDRAEKKIRREYNLEPTAQEIYDTAMDAKVKQILAGEPFKSQREQMAKDRELFQRAKQYMDYSAHSFWEVKNLSSIGVPEPPRGCPDCRADYEEWLATPARNYFPAEPTPLETAYDKLQNVHTEYMKSLKEKKPKTPITIRGSGYAEEPEP